MYGSICLRTAEVKTASKPGGDWRIHLSNQPRKQEDDSFFNRHAN